MTNLNSRDFLDRIPNYAQPKRKPPRVSVSTTIEQSTLEFATKEAEARGMTVGLWIRHILELLESGEF